MCKFGVCLCDLDMYQPEIRDLVRFDTYESAYEYYMQLAVSDDNPQMINKYVWIVWIQNDTIVQFDQLNWVSKTKYMELKI